MIDNSYSIYKLTSPSGKSYIGQTIDYQRRMREYLLAPVRYKTKIFKAIRKYKFESFSTEVIQTVNVGKHGKDKALEVLNILEKMWISKFDSIKTGYNLASGGKDFRHSEESKNKMSKSAIGKIVSEETRTRMSIASTGRIHTDETKRKISEHSLALTEETREKLRVARIETSDQMAESRRSNNNGSWFTDAGREKIRLGQLKVAALRKKPVLQYDLNMNFIAEFDCMLTAAKECGLNKSSIWKNLNGKSIIPKRYIWEYKYKQVK